MPGHFRRARVHSVFASQSGGRGKFAYSRPGYSRNGFWARRALQPASATGTNRNAARNRIHFFKARDLSPQYHTAGGARRTYVTNLRAAIDSVALKQYTAEHRRAHDDGSPPIY